MIDVQTQRLAMYSKNALKLGIFGSNCSSGLAATKVPERWSGSWADNLALATMLDDAGMEFMLPVGRWKGYGGETNFESATFETITWATGLLAETTRITVFGTVHAPLLHPVFAAKQFVTADHVGRGRFGLNVVCGWNQDEFDMFGAEQRGHDSRYAYGAEWLEIVKRIWDCDVEFDYSGEYFRLEKVQGDPKPYAGSRPLIMNAGASPAGQTFAVERADYLFIPLRALERGAEDVRKLRERAQGIDRNVGIFTNANVVCRPTQREADDYFRWFADEMADWGAVDHMHQMGQKNAVSVHASEEAFQRIRVLYAAGYGGFPCVGDPDRVAADLARISSLGFTGVALGFCNYLLEFPFFRDEVLPRLERMGLR